MALSFQLFIYTMSKWELIGFISDHLAQALTGKMKINQKLNFLGEK